MITYTPEKETFGGYINISIDKKTGKIMLIWFGE